MKKWWPFFIGAASCSLILERERLPPRSFQIDTPPTPGAIFLEDLNQDGFLDIINVSFSDVLSVFKGEEDGDFTLLKSVKIEEDARYINFILIDVNNDSKIDFICQDLFRFAIFLGTGDDNFFESPSFVNESFLPGELNPSFASLATAADFDGDNIADIFYNNISFGRYEFRRGNGDGTFQEPERKAAPNTILVKPVGDFDKDGISEGLSSRAILDNNFDLVSSDLSLVSKTQNDIVEETIFSQEGSSFGNVEIIDYDGDGELDIVFIISDAQNSNEKVFVMRGNGDNTFEEPAHLLDLSITVTLHVIDINGDGLFDFFAPTDESFVQIGGSFIQQPDSSFQEANILPEFGEEFDTGDINRDGALDFVGSNQGESTIMIVLGQPSK